MFERAEGIYEIRLHNNDLGVSEIKIFVIPGNPGKRSLMIDTGFGNEECYRRLKKGMEELGISCEPVRTDAYTGKKMTFFFDPDGLPLELHE